MNKDLNLSAIVMRKKPGYKSCKKHKIFDNLLKQKFNVDEKNKIWCTDFTYMRQPNGKFRYNCTIMDLFDRSAIASVNSDYINTELAIETLTEALKKEKPNNGILLHSDQGVQYTSWEFVNFCKDNGVIQSMSKAGCPYDNAPMERFYNTFKNCFYYRYTFESVEQLDEMTKQYINWYNVSAKYSCGFPNPQVSPIIVVDRYLDYFTTIMEDRLWQVLAKPVFRWRNSSGLLMNAVRAA